MSRDAEQSKPDDLVIGNGDEVVVPVTSAFGGAPELKVGIVVSTELEEFSGNRAMIRLHDGGFISSLKSTISWTPEEAFAKAKNRRKKRLK